MSLRHAILGFLEIEPTTGYTLQQRFEGSVGSFWSATQSQIYRELHALERDRQVQVRTVPQAGKPPRKVYSLTAAGRKQLQAWLQAPLEAMQLRDPLQLKLVFSAGVDAQHLDALLKAHEAALTSQLQEYRARLGSPAIFSLARSERERVLWQLSIESGIGFCEAQLQWTVQARRRLSKTKVTRGTKT